MRVVLAIGSSCLAMALVVLSRKLYRGRLSPLASYGGIWFLSLALYWGGPISYEPLSLRAWLVIGLSLTAFAFGCLTASLPICGRQPTTTRRLSRKRLRFVIVVLSFLGLTSALYMLLRVLVRLGPSAYQSISDVQQAYYVSGIGYFYLLNTLVPLFCARYLISFDKRSIGMYLLATLCMSMLVLPGTRTGLLTALGSLVMMLAYGRRKIEVKWLGTGAMIVVLVFAALAPFKTPGLQRALTDAFMVGVGAIDPAWVRSPLVYLLQPYAYLTANLPAFSQFMERADSYGLGWNSFGMLLKPLLYLYHANYPPIHYEFSETPYRTNTYTYLREPYADSGLAGCVMMASSLGFLSTLIFRKTYAQGRYLSVAGLVGWYLLLTVRSNHFRFPGTWWLIGVAFFCEALIWVKGSRSASQRTNTGSDCGYINFDDSHAAAGYDEHR